jgi:outer membrane protein W
MKKILITSILFLSAIAVQAQLKTDAGTFEKPSAKSLLFEVNFSPDLTGSGSPFSLPFLAQGSDIVVIKARRYMSDNKSLRILANISLDNDKGEDELVDNSTTFALGAGIEKHFAGKERISPYFGYGGAFGLNLTSEEFVGFDGTEGTSSTSTMAFSAGMFAGFDYYIMPDIYLGMEVNYGFGFNSVTKDDGVDGTDDIKSSSLMLAPGVSPAIRLGWRLK